MRCIRIFVCLSVLLIASCASIPLSTMAKMATFGEQDFANLDPADLRVRLTTLDPFKLRPDSLYFEVDMKDAETKQPIEGLPQGKFKLRVLSQERHTVDGGLFSDDASGNRYVLTLTQDQYEVFRAYQAFAVKKEKSTKSSGSFGVKFEFEKVEPVEARPSETQLWIDLKLKHDEPFMTLVDGATMTIN